MLKQLAILTYLIFRISSFAYADELNTLDSKFPDQQQNKQYLYLNSIQELKESGRLRSGWDVSLEAKRNQDALSNQRTQAIFSLNLHGEYDLTSFLNLKADPKLLFKNGNVQSDSATSGKSNTVELSEGSANFHYNESAELSLGALNQSKNASGLLVDSIAFPAARMTGQIGSVQESFASASAQLAIPTSAALTSNSRDYEKTPTFSLLSLKGKALYEKFSVLPRFSVFEYKNLPSGVANDSGLLGNSVTNTSGASSSASQFLYEFRGYEAGLALRFDLTENLGFVLSGQYLENTAAPKAYGQGSTLFSAVEYWMGPLKWTPSFEYFRISPDAGVAYYNSPLYQTNRVGYQGGLALQYKEIFTVAVKGGARDVVFESSSQNRENFYSLALETLHASF